MTTDPTAPVPPDANGLREAVAEHLHERFAADHEPHWFEMDEYEQAATIAADMARSLFEPGAPLAASEAAPTAGETKFQRQYRRAGQRLDDLPDGSFTLTRPLVPTILAEQGTCPSRCAATHAGREHDEAEDGCRCAELCAMGPTCPGANASLHRDCWRTLPATPPADDASERRFRDPVTGDVGPVHDPVCAALAHDDEDSCSCGAMDAASTDASEGLSEAEREALVETIADGRVADSIAQHGPAKDHALLHRVLRAECARFVEHATPAVERIVAARESAAATRARAEGAAEAGGRVARTLIAERNARVLHSPAWFAFDDAARLARSDAAPHTGAQPVDWDSPTWGGGVHHATTDDLGDHGRHADETDEQ